MPSFDCWNRDVRSNSGSLNDRTYTSVQRTRSRFVRSVYWRWGLALNKRIFSILVVHKLVKSYECVHSYTACLYSYLHIFLISCSVSNTYQIHLTLLIFLSSLSILLCLFYTDWAFFLPVYNHFFHKST